MDGLELKAAFGLNVEDPEEAVDPQEDELATDEGTLEEEETEEKLEEETEEDVEEVANPQSEEINRAAAAARRQAEEQLRTLTEETNKKNKSVDVLMKALNNFGYSGTPEEIADMLNANRTGKTIESIRDEREAEEERIQNLIDEHPAVLEAKRLSEEAIQEKNRQMFERELANIQKINPDIKTLNDLQNLGEDQEAFNAMIKGGLHIDAAYKVIAAQKTPTKPKQDTKSHIKTVNGAGTPQGAVIVPREERQLIKEMMPGITDKEIDEWYKKRK